MTDKSMPSQGVEQALQTLLSQIELAPAEVTPIDQAQGLVLAQSLESQEQHPADDTSAMDGYAIRSEDVSSASAQEPVELEIVEDIRAGFPPRLELANRQCSRISTGGLIPSGADAVIMREQSEVLSDQKVRFKEPAVAGQNIRFTGEHLQAGEMVLSPGTVLGPAHIGMAAFLGAEVLRCYPAVTVAILATGSELVTSQQHMARGQIRDSNSVMLAAAVQALGCKVTMKARVPDLPEALDEALDEAFSKAKVVLTSGGISAGWHDLVRERMEQLGGVFSFHKLRMRPGKPLAFGHTERSHFFCLPGNPVSSLVTFEILVKPALLKMMGRRHEPATQKAKLLDTIAKKKGFTIYYRGLMEQTESGETTVRLTGPQGSHILRSLVDANVLIKAPEDAEVLDLGSQVEVIPL